MVFEGGKGDWAAPDPSDRKPYWRLHICLSETEKEKTGEVKINLKELNTVYKQRGTIGGKPYVNHLNEVTIKYSYVAHFYRYDDNFSYGKASVNSQSLQNWLQVEGPQRDPSDLESFSPSFDINMLGNYRISGYLEDDGTGMYLGYAYKRVVLDQPKIEACEKANAPYVLEILK